MIKFIISLVLSLAIISCGNSSSELTYLSENVQTDNNQQSNSRWTGTRQEAYYYLESTIEDLSNYVLNAHNIYFVSDNEFYNKFLTLARKNLSELKEIAKNNGDTILEEKTKLADKKIYVLDNALLNVVGNEKINKDSYPSYIDTSKIFQLKLFYAPACAGINQELYFMCIDQNKLEDYINDNFSDTNTLISSSELLNDTKQFSTWYRDHVKKDADEQFKTWMNNIIADNIELVIKDAKISDLVDGALKDKPWFIKDLTCLEYASKLKEHSNIQQPLIIKKLETIARLIEQIKKDDSTTLNDSVSLNIKVLNTPIVSLTQNGSDLSYDETDINRQAAKQAIEQISKIVSSNFNTTISLNSKTLVKLENSFNSIGSLSTYVTNAGWEDLHDEINELITSVVAYYDFYRRIDKVEINDQTTQVFDRCSQALDQINQIIDGITKK